MSTTRHVYTRYSLQTTIFNHQQFPRVTVYLDKDSLVITDECKRDMESVKTKQGLIAFSNKYGS